MKMEIWVGIVLIAVVLAVVVFAIIQQSASKKAGDKPRPVSEQLKWLNQSQFVGTYSGAK